MLKWSKTINTIISKGQIFKSSLITFYWLFIVKMKHFISKIETNYEILTFNNKQLWILNSFLNFYFFCFVLFNSYLIICLSFWIFFYILKCRNDAETNRRISISTLVHFDLLPNFKSNIRTWKSKILIVLMSWQSNCTFKSKTKR